MSFDWIPISSDTSLPVGSWVSTSFEYQVGSSSSCIALCRWGWLHKNRSKYLCTSPKYLQSRPRGRSRARGTLSSLTSIALQNREARIYGWTPPIAAPIISISKPATGQSFVCLTQPRIPSIPSLSPSSQPAAKQPSCGQREAKVALPCAQRKTISHFLPVLFNAPPLQIFSLRQHQPSVPATHV